MATRVPIIVITSNAIDGRWKASPARSNIENNEIYLIRHKIDAIWSNRTATVYHPSMVKLKRHFFVVQMRVLDPDSSYRPDESDIVAGIQAPFTEMFGLLGAGSVLTTLRIFDWNRPKRTGVIRVPSSWSANARTFFESLTVFGGTEVRFVLHHISTGIDKAREWINANETVFF